MTRDEIEERVFGPAETDRPKAVAFNQALMMLCPDLAYRMMNRGGGQLQTEKRRRLFKIFEEAGIVEPRGNRGAYYGFRDEYSRLGTARYRGALSFNGIEAAREAFEIVGLIDAH